MTHFPNTTSSQDLFGSNIVSINPDQNFISSDKSQTSLCSSSAAHKVLVALHSSPLAEFKAIAAWVLGQLTFNKVIGQIKQHLNT
jgi:hypothetical protein